MADAAEESSRVTPERYFYFSYARENRRNANRERPDGSTYNLVDQLFERLCRCVSDVTGISGEQIGYQDVSALQVNTAWSPALVHAMQQSQILIALISPHYLRSVACGREFEVFVRRLAKLRQQTGQQNIASRIIPLFWLNADQCWPYATVPARQYLGEFQLIGPGFPEEYPSVGLSRLRLLGKPQTYEEICLRLADRIAELAESEPALPALDAIADFQQLPSAFDPAQQNDKPVEELQAPIFNLGDMPAPAGIGGAAAPPGLHLGP